MDELHPAVNAVQGPVDVGHDCSSRARARTTWWCALRGDRRPVGGGGGESDRWPRDPGAVLGVPSWGAPVVAVARAYTGSPEACGRYRGAAIDRSRPKPGFRTCRRRDTRPVTMARRDSAWRDGSDGGARIAAGSRGRPARPESARIVPGHGSAGRVRPLAGPGRLADLGRDHGTDHQGGSRTACSDLLHTADVHLGARHADLGDAAARPARAPVRRVPARRRPRDRREGRPVPRRRRPVRLQRPARRSVERVAARARPARAGPDPLGPRARAPTTSTTARRSTAPTTSRRWPGRRPPRTSSSPSSRRTTRGSTSQALDAVVHGPCFPTKRAPYSPLRDLAARRGARTPPGTSASSTRASRSPGRTDHDEVVVTVEEIAASGLDYLALGHWHCAQVAKTKGVTYAYAGRARARRRRPGQGRQGAPRDARRRQTGQHTVEVEERVVGRTTFERREIDAATVGSQPALVAKLTKGGEPGPRPRRPAHRRPARRARPRHRRGRAGAPGQRTSASASATSSQPGADARARSRRRRRSPARSSATSRAGSPTSRRPATTWLAREADELRDVLRLGRLLLAGRGGDAVRITSLALTRPPPLPGRRRSSWRPGLTIVRGPNEAGKSTIQRAIELALTRKVTSSAARPRRAGPVGRRSGRAHVGRAGVHLRGRGGRAARGPAREVVPRRQGRRSASSSTATSITDPARADEELAELSGVPDRGLLPLDGVGPPPRAGRAPARRGRPARPAPGLDQRRRPGDEPRQAQARARAPRPADARRQEPGPAQGRRGRGRPTSRRAAPGRRGRALSGSSTTATRSPWPASAVPRPTPRSSSAGRCSRRRARPSG